jgi:small subunit ribosomal protein S5e
MAETAPVAEAVEAPESMYDTLPKLFGKWQYEGLDINDISLKDYISIESSRAKTFIPHTAGRWQLKRFHKAKCPIVERLVNSLMAHGRNSGKKMMALRIVQHAFEIIHILTGQNPIQILIEAVSKSGPREDSTRIGTGGVARRQAVDVSPLRRVNVAIYLITSGARAAAFRNIRSIAECLADEIMNAAKESANSYSIRKKDEIERIAKGNR